MMATASQRWHILKVSFIVLPIILLFSWIPFVSAFSNFRYPATRASFSFSSTTRHYYLPEPTDEKSTLASTEPKTASFKTSASENDNWQAALDELIQGISGDQRITFFSPSQSTTNVQVTNNYDRQEAFSRALLEARLAMERRQRSDRQEAFFRTLLEARLKLERRQRLHKTRQKSTMVFLFVGQYYAHSFEKIVACCQEKLQQATEVVAVLGGGVIGGGSELDQTDKPAMSMLSGNLPRDSIATFFQYEDGADDSMAHVLPPTPPREELDRPPSYMIFADPFAPLASLLEHLEDPNSPRVVAGGVSVPPRRRRVPSIARNGRVLRAGSLVGVEFTGNVGLQAVVAQGCRPVGPTFVITKASGTILTGLSGESAISRLEEVAANADKQDQELIRNGELVCGLGPGDGSGIVQSLPNDRHECQEGEPGGMVRIDDDFLIRQIMGFRPVSGSIVVAAGGLKEGNTFRFHVRAAKSAREDMDLMIQRAKTERLFAGSSNLRKMGQGGPSASAGKPLAAFQFSCVARGRSFFGAPNVDLKKVEELFGEREKESPIAGFFANGEIGPVGIRTSDVSSKLATQSIKPTSSSTFLHGFTTVVAMLCDYSESSRSGATSEMSESAIIVNNMDGAWA